MSGRRIIGRGDRVWASKDPVVGHEQAGRRPWLVLSHDVMHRSMELAIVVPMTHTDRGWTTHVRMNPGTGGAPEVAMAEQVQAMSLRRVLSVDTAPYSLDLVDQVHTIMTRLTAPRR